MPLRVVVRSLPGALTEPELRAALTPLMKQPWESALSYFVPGKMRGETTVFTGRAYFEFDSEDSAAAFIDLLKDRQLFDASGAPFSHSAEYTLTQKCVKSNGMKDHREGLIVADSVHKAFMARLAEPKAKAAPVLIGGEPKAEEPPPEAALVAFLRTRKRVIVKTGEALKRPMKPAKAKKGIVAPVPQPLAAGTANFAGAAKRGGGAVAAAAPAPSPHPAPRPARPARSQETTTPTHSRASHAAVAEEAPKVPKFTIMKKAPAPEAPPAAAPAPAPLPPPVTSFRPPPGIVFPTAAAEAPPVFASAAAAPVAAPAAAPEPKRGPKPAYNRGVYRPPPRRTQPTE